MNEWQETAIGDLPLEWSTQPFSEIIEDGFLSYGVVQPGPHKEHDSVPIIRVQNIKNGAIHPEDIKRIGSTIEAKYRRTRLKGGELLVTVVGTVGETAIVLDIYKGWNVARAVSVSRISNKFDIKFIKYCFSSVHVKHQIYGRTNDTVQPTLNLSSLRDLLFPIPPLREQKAITAVLSALDDKIDLLHRQNKTLESMAQALFRHWFIDNAADDWVDSVIPDEFDFTMGLSPPGSSYNENGDGVPMFQGNADFGFRFPENRVYTTDPRRFAEQYDTLISVRAPVGAQNMAFEKCCIGRGVAAFRYKRNPSYYTYAYFKLRSLMDEIRQFNNEGTVFGSISKRDFMAFEITIPSYEAVDQFQTSVKPIDDKVIANYKQIRTLEKLRDTLLPKLMSGEVRVRQN
jgi:type I restriction enzyme, S subunit